MERAFYGSLGADLPRKTVWVFAVPSISGDFRTQVEARQATGVHLLCSPEEGSPAFLLRNSLGARVHAVQVSVHLYLLGIWVRARGLPCQTYPPQY